MKFQTGNKNVVKQLSKKSLRANKCRNIVAVIAIILTTILFTSLFTISLGMKSSSEESTFRMAGGYAEGSFKNLTKKQYEKLKTHPLIKESSYSIFVGIAENEELIKHQTEIRYFEPVAAKWMYAEVTEGRMPETADEIALDTTVLKLLGVPCEIGAKVPISYKINDKLVEKELTVTGYWDMAKGVEVSEVCVGMPFIKQNLANLDKEDRFQGIGGINMDVMLKNSSNIEKAIYKITEDSGFVPDGQDDNSINVGINWGYMNARGLATNPMAILGILLGCGLIMFTGYLIIYNVFQISVIADINFYGLLKTIGTTPKQIRYIIRKQALYLSLIGIPLGLVLGYAIGNSLLPIIIETTNIAGAYSSTSPVVFIGAAIFALLTVFISCRKPGRIAAHISPIEASKYSEVSKCQVKSRNTNKNNIGNMAYRNITRNKKKTTVIVMSLALSMILLNSVYTFTQGFDMDKYLSKVVVTDFVLGSANYFSTNKFFRFEEDQPSSQYIEAVKGLEGVKDGGYIYYDIKETKDASQELFLQLYGVDESLLNKFEVIEGNLDAKKLKTGDYIIEGIEPNDYNEIVEGRSKYKIGDKVSIKNTGDSQEVGTYEVMAKIKIPGNATVRYSPFGESTNLYLPSTVFKKDVKNPLKMAYFIDANKEQNEQIEKFISHYTNDVEASMDYESKQKYVDSFEGVRDMYLVVGLIASIVVGMIGIVNFINAMMTSILTRRGEFAILQSIGMTTKQLRKMLILEGVLYSAITIIVSVVLGTIASFLIVKPIGEQLWFFTYHFKVMPLVVVSPCMILLSILVPFTIYKIIGKQTIVERLRGLN
ncbi:MAG: ABC transporter permease [Cellulosilyticaceae bacterium]